MAGYVPKLPLKLDSRQGYTMIEDLKGLVIQNFLMILLTNPGERVMDSNFGVGLKRLLFENYSSTAIVLFEQRLNNQAKIHMPYINITSIDYNTTEQDESLLSIKFKIYIIPLATSSNITIQSNGETIIS
jgi:hypothetical protein